MVNQEKKIRRPLPGTDTEAGASRVIGRHHLSDMRLLSDDGASGLVYAAVERDWRGTGIAARFVVKELYPLSCADRIAREGSALVVADGEPPLELAAGRDAFRGAFREQARAYQGGAREAVSVPVDMVEANNTVYLISDASEGATLDAAVATMSPVEQLSAIEGVCNAVAALHDAGYAYLDLKPANILVLESGGGVKLFDFDSVASLADLAAGDAAVLGSEGWSSWEQMHLGTAGSVGKGSDVYAAGALVFWLAFGRAPSDTEVIRADGRWRLSAQRGGHPALTGSAQATSALERILSKTLTCDADKRFCSMRELRAAISALREAISPAPASTMGAIEEKAGEIVGEVRSSERRIVEALDARLLSALAAPAEGEGGCAARGACIALLPEAGEGTPSDWTAPADPGIDPGDLNGEQRAILSLLALAGETGVLEDAVARCCGLRDRIDLGRLKGAGLVEASPSTGMVRLPGWADRHAAFAAGHDDGATWALLDALGSSAYGGQADARTLALARDAASLLADGDAPLPAGFLRILCDGGGGGAELLGPLERSAREHDRRGDAQGALSARVGSATIMARLNMEAQFEALCEDMAAALLGLGDPRRALDLWRIASRLEFFSEPTTKATVSLLEELPEQERDDTDKTMAALGLIRLSWPDPKEDYPTGYLVEPLSRAEKIADEVEDESARLTLLARVSMPMSANYCSIIADKIIDDIMRRDDPDFPLWLLAGIAKGYVVDLDLDPIKKVADWCLAEGRPFDEPLLFELNNLVHYTYDAFLDEEAASAHYISYDGRDFSWLVPLAGKIAGRAASLLPATAEALRAACAYEEIRIHFGIAPDQDWGPKRKNLLGCQLAARRAACEERGQADSARALALVEYADLLGRAEELGWKVPSESQKSIARLYESAWELLRNSGEADLANGWAEVLVALRHKTRLLPRWDVETGDENSSHVGNAVGPLTLDDEKAAAAYLRWAIALEPPRKLHWTVARMLLDLGTTCNELGADPSLVLSACDKAFEFDSAEQFFLVRSDILRLKAACLERAGDFDAAADTRMCYGYGTRKLIDETLERVGRISDAKASECLAKALSWLGLGKPDTPPDYSGYKVYESRTSNFRDQLTEQEWIDRERARFAKETIEPLEDAVRCCEALAAISSRRIHKLEM